MCDQNSPLLISVHPKKKKSVLIPSLKGQVMQFKMEGDRLRTERGSNYRAADNTPASGKMFRKRFPSHVTLQSVAVEAPWGWKQEGRKGDETGNRHSSRIKWRKATQNQAAVIPHAPPPWSQKTTKDGTQEPASSLGVDFGRRESGALRKMNIRSVSTDPWI